MPLIQYFDEVPQLCYPGHWYCPNLATRSSLRLWLLNLESVWYQWWQGPITIDLLVTNFSGSLALCYKHMHVLLSHACSWLITLQPMAWPSWPSPVISSVPRWLAIPRRPRSRWVQPGVSFAATLMLTCSGISKPSSCWLKTCWFGILDTSRTCN